MMSAMLHSILAVTITVPALAPIEAAYTSALEMRVVERGRVSRATAAGWGAPSVAGCAFLVLQPAIGEATSLRFIEDPQAGSAAPFTRFGWNATEISVQDTDALARRLAHSGFRIIGAPANLTGFEWIRAMQVLGPADECLYLTDVSADASLAQAPCAVGPVFITVVGGPDMEALAAFYRTRFGNEVSAPVTVPISVINDANHLPATHCHPLALVTLQGGTRIELDQYPTTATPRPVRAGHLPPGMAMVSFRVATLGEMASPGAMSIGDMTPVAGMRVACIAGAAGELIELCETGGP